MAFYPDVQPGDEFKPNAQLSNDVRHILNHLDGFTGGDSKAIRQNHNTIKVYSDEMLLPGDCVNLIDGDMIQGAVPCELYWDHCKPCGVLFDWIKPHGFGYCIIGGAAKVNEHSQYLYPWVEGTNFTSSVNRVLLLSPYLHNNYKINGEISGQPYEGFFKVAVEETDESSFLAKVVMGGIAKRSYCGTVIYNGKMVEIPEQSVSITEDIVSLGLKLKFTSDSKIDAKVVRFVKIGNYAQPENGENFVTGYYPGSGIHEYWGHKLCDLKWRKIDVDDVVKKKVYIINQDSKIYEPLQLKKKG